MQATVLDEAGFPLEDGEVNGEIISPGGQGEQLELTEVEGGWGVYSTEFLPQEGGAYQIKIDAPEHDRELETKIVVSLPKREKLGRPVNRPVLAEIASITQSESANTDNLDEIIQKSQSCPSHNRPNSAPASGATPGGVEPSCCSSSSTGPAAN